MDNLTLIVISGVILILILGISKLIKESSKHQEFPPEIIIERENSKLKIKPKNIMETEFMEPITNANAISISEFNERLTEWVNHPNSAGRIGNAQYGQNPHIHVKDGDKIYRLNADTQKIGVKEYLNKYKDTKWVVVENQRGTINAVAFGSQPYRIPFFYFYLILN